MPTLSTHELARHGHTLEYDEDDGVIRNKATGNTTGFIVAAGVYLVPLLVHKDTVGDSSLGFVRQG